MHPNPYGADLGDRDPLTALSETPWRIEAIVASWTDAQFERSYALRTRARFALSQDGYVAQSFDQDAWMPLDDGTDARTALAAYVALRKLNLQMWRGLTGAQRAQTFTHPDFGELSVEWIAAQMAGHDIHHLKQFETIAR
jgi:hypothetical protein